MWCSGVTIRSQISRRGSAESLIAGVFFSEKARYHNARYFTRSRCIYGSMKGSSFLWSEGPGRSIFSFRELVSC